MIAALLAVIILGSYCNQAILYSVVSLVTVSYFILQAWFWPAAEISPFYIFFFFCLCESYFFLKALFWAAAAITKCSSMRPGFSQSLVSLEPVLGIRIRMFWASRVR
jgi:hypothetical protein